MQRTRDLHYSLRRPGYLCRFDTRVWQIHLMSSKVWGESRIFFIRDRFCFFGRGQKINIVIRDPGSVSFLSLLKLFLPLGHNTQEGVRSVFASAPMPPHVSFFHKGHRILFWISSGAYAPYAPQLNTPVINCNNRDVSRNFFISGRFYF